MADFLTRLASRTLGLAPMAEPLIAPMFAPEAPAPSITGSDEPLDAAPQAVEPVAPRAAAGLPSASPLENRERAVAARPRPDPAEARPAPPRMGETASRTSLAAPDDAFVSEFPPRRLPQRAPAAASETGDDDAHLMPAAGAPQRQSPVRRATPAATTPLGRPDSPDLFPTPAPGPADRVAAASRSALRQGRAGPSWWDGEPDETLLLPRDAVAAPLAPQTAPAGGGRDLGRAVASVTPAAEAAPPRRAERAEAAAVPASPPTIEVTIGRVEVRAVHSPAPVARPKGGAPVAPGLSLEEYLRTQGERR